MGNEIISEKIGGKIGEKLGNITGKFFGKNLGGALAAAAIATVPSPATAAVVEGVSDVLAGKDIIEKVDGIGGVALEKAINNNSFNWAGDEPPEEVFSDESARGIAENMASFDNLIKKFKFDINLNKEEAGKQLDEALERLNGCVYNVNEKEKGDISKACKSGVEAVKEASLKYQSGHLSDELFLGQALNLKSFLDNYVSRYNERRDEWLQQKAK